jgi:hypothetical protein
MKIFPAALAFRLIRRRVYFLADARAASLNQ